MVKYIISHKNPDTDTICSSIVYSNYLNSENIEAVPIKLGNLNNETKFILEKFGFEIPITKLSLDENSEVILVDHNEETQSIDDLEKLKIVGIIDHHKFKLKTSEPLMIRAEVLGSTCSILSKIFFENGYDLSKNEASILIAAILSDTLFFRSPTTTNDDKLIVDRLNKVAKIPDLENFSLEMFEAKSDLGDISTEDLIKLDYKVFDFNGKKFGISVMETTNPNYGLSRKDEIIAKLKEIKKRENLDGILFSIVDILNEVNSTLFSDDFEKEVLFKVFKVKGEDNFVDLGNRVSRKKQLVPFLEKYFE